MVDGGNDDEVEVVGRRLQVVGGWCTQAIFLTVISAFYLIGSVPAYGAYVVPAMSIVWIALMWGVALSRFGLLTADRAKPPKSSVVAFYIAAMLGLGLAMTTTFGPVQGWLTHTHSFNASVGAWMAVLAIFVILCVFPWNPQEKRPKEMKRAFSRGGGVAPDRAGKPPEPHGTIICCSGGGIRSAAFSLGALQRLDEVGVVSASQALVAVSGGSYIAAAYVALRSDLAGQGANDAVARPFAEGTPEVAQLRKATNYLASSARVKYDGVVSWLLGAMLNAAMVWGALSVIAGLVAWQAWYAKEIQAGAHFQWSYHHGRNAEWWWLALPLAGLTVFLADRYGDLRPMPRWLAKWWDAREHSESIRTFWSGTRLALTNLGLVLVAAVWIVPALAVLGHNAALNNEPTAGLAWFLAHTGFASANDCLALLPHTHRACGLTATSSSGHVKDTFASGLPVHAAGVISATVVATTLWGLVRSAMKGWKVLETEASWFTALLIRFRRQIAPLVASALFMGVILYAGTAWVAALCSEPTKFDRLALANPFVNGLLLILAWSVPANALSLFHFYRNRIADGFLLTRPASNRAKTLHRSKWPKMSTLGRDRCPELVLTATANIQDGDMLPTGRNGAQFVFAGHHIGLHDSDLPGSEDRRWVTSGRYEEEQEGLTVADAVAVSGAAIAPLAGRESKVVAPFRALMAVANVRMGMWVPNPCWIPDPDKLKKLNKGGKALVWLDRWLRRPTAWNLAREAFTPPSIYRAHLYLTDGGHYDNLGLVEALRRRPSRVIVLDASADAEDGFATMGAAVATARIDRVADIADFDPRPLVRGKARYSQRAWVECTARYYDPPDLPQSRTTITYLKSVLTRQLSSDLASYKILHPDFPLTSTGDQLFDEFDFEAYRHLGYTLVAQAQEEGGMPSAKPERSRRRPMRSRSRALCRRKGTDGAD
jgi:hypothetical protein